MVGSGTTRARWAAAMAALAAALALLAFGLHFRALHLPAGYPDAGMVEGWLLVQATAAGLAALVPAAAAAWLSPARWGGWVLGAAVLGAFVAWASLQAL